MIDIELLDILVEAVTEMVKETRVEDDKGNLRSIAVVKGFLPPKRTEELEEYEKFCILIRLDEGEATFDAAEEQAKAVNRVIIAVRTASMDVQKGPRNTTNIMAMLQRKLYAFPVLAQKYRATFPMKWKAPPGDSLPIWQGEMTIPWIVPTVQEEINFESEEY